MNPSLSNQLWVYRKAEFRICKIVGLVFKEVILIENSIYMHLMKAFIKKRLLSKEKKSVKRIQILDKDDCVSFHADALKKRMHLSVILLVIR